MYEQIQDLFHQIMNDCELLYNREPRLDDAILPSLRILMKVTNYPYYPQKINSIDNVFTYIESIYDDKTVKNIRVLRIEVEYIIRRRT